MVTKIWVNIGTGNGQHQAITRTNADSISEVLWHLPKNNFKVIAQAIILYYEFKNHTLTHCPQGRFEWNLMQVIFKLISVIDGWGISCETAVRWMSLDLSDDKSALVLVMAWCRQATSHYLSQCWPRSLTPYGVTRPQWVKNHCHITQGTMS